MPEKFQKEKIDIELSFDDITLQSLEILSARIKAICPNLTFRTMSVGNDNQIIEGVQPMLDKDAHFARGLCQAKVITLKNFIFTVEGTGLEPDPLDNDDMEDEEEKQPEDDNENEEMTDQEEVKIDTEVESADTQNTKV